MSLVRVSSGLGVLSKRQGLRESTRLIAMTTNSDPYADNDPTGVLPLVGDDDGDRGNGVHAREPASASTEKVLTNYKQKLHAAATFVLFISFILCISAVAYRPFEPKWTDTLTVAKVMAPVKRGYGTLRCTDDPCSVFASQYTTIPTASYFQAKSTTFTECPRIPGVVSAMIAKTCSAVGVTNVDVDVTCSAMQPYAIDAMSNRTDGTRGKVRISSVLLARVLDGTKIDTLYLAYVALPALLASGVDEAEALRIVRKATKVVKSQVTTPREVLIADVAEAAAVQVMCMMGTTGPVITDGLGCTRE
jgi:hypothetical protein